MQGKYLLRFVQVLLYLGGYRTKTCKKVYTSLTEGFQHVLNLFILHKLHNDKTFISSKIHVTMHRRHHRHYIPACLISQSTYTNTFKF